VGGRPRTLEGVLHGAHVLAGEVVVRVEAVQVEGVPAEEDVEVRVLGRGRGGEGPGVVP